MAAIELEVNVLQRSSVFAIVQKDIETGRSVLRDRVSGAEIDVPGLLLEEEFVEASGRHVLYLLDDCPFEEGLHILCLDSRGTIIDRIGNRTAYATGMLDILAFADTHIDFTFFGKSCPYRLTLEASPVMLPRLPRGWIYPGLRARHWMTLTVLEDQSVAGGAAHT